MVNDIIKQLADEATSYADTLDVADQRIYQKIRDREFAQLIVRECEKVSLKSSHRDDDMGAIIARQIKEHFGVEL